MVHPVDIYVGQRLRQRRTMLGFSQEALAKKVGITFQQVQKYERGTNRIGASRMWEFAQILDIPVNFFFDGFEEKTGQSLATGLSEPSNNFVYDDPLTDRETLEVAMAFNRINEKKTRHSISNMIKAVSNNLAITEDS